ncbi:unnamed protein product [Moneuplotes crassus]|uniref:Uncharacterized protein n=1 Tax=Euplotes crassus TaxID=5936 RepID=A0AAD1Y5S7_EUPCR|nr:unnamed protein product [Moneuplotes crassus]
MFPFITICGQITKPSTYNLAILIFLNESRISKRLNMQKTKNKRMQPCDRLKTLLKKYLNLNAIFLHKEDQNQRKQDEIYQVNLKELCVVPNSECKSIPLFNSPNSFKQVRKQVPCNCGFSIKARKWCEPSLT